MEGEKIYKRIFNNELYYFKKWFICEKIGERDGLSKREIKTTCDNYFKLYKDLQLKRKKMQELRQKNNIDI